MARRKEGVRRAYREVLSLKDLSPEQKVELMKKKIESVEKVWIVAIIASVFVLLILLRFFFLFEANEQNQMVAYMAGYTDGSKAFYDYMVEKLSTDGYFPLTFVYNNRTYYVDLYPVVKKVGNETSRGLAKGR